MTFPQDFEPSDCNCKASEISKPKACSAKPPLSKTHQKEAWICTSTNSAIGASPWVRFLGVCGSLDASLEVSLVASLAVELTTLAKINSGRMKTGSQNFHERMSSFQSWNMHFFISWSSGTNLNLNPLTLGPSYLGSTTTSEPCIQFIGFPGPSLGKRWFPTGGYKESGTLK